VRIGGCDFTQVVINDDLGLETALGEQPNERLCVVWCGVVWCGVVFGADLWALLAVHLSRRGTIGRRGDQWQLDFVYVVIYIFVDRI
jgi:hypothetical protein